METTQQRGWTAWDRALLPPDEFEERVRAVQRLMVDVDTQAAVVWRLPQVFGSGTREYANCAYVAGAVENNTVIIPREGTEVAFVSNSGARQAGFNRTLTWIPDYQSAAGPALSKCVRTLLEARGVRSGRIGSVGALPPSAITALGGYEFQDISREYERLRVAKRPRELTLLQRACKIAADAAHAAEKVFNAGGTNVQALVEAEYVATANRGRDVRLLANIDADELRPHEALTSESARRHELLLWLGLEYQGYRAEAALTAPDNSAAADAAIQAMTRAARAGAPARAVAEDAQAVLADDAAETAFAYGFGQGAGLSRNEPPLLQRQNSESLVEGSVLQLRVLAGSGAAASFATALVRVGAERGEPLPPE